MNVKVLRMNTGEDVIFTLVEDKEESIVVENILVAVNGGQGQIGFGPWAPLVKNGETIEIERKFIVYIAEPQEDVSEQYQKIFSTIETPSKKLILMKKVILAGLLLGAAHGMTVPAQAHSNHHGHSHGHHGYRAPRHNHCHRHPRLGYGHCHKHKHGGPGQGHHGQTLPSSNPSVVSWQRTTPLPILMYATK